MEAYNRAPAPISRPQTYSNPQSRLAYGPSYYNGGGYNGGERRAAPAQSYGAPAQSFQRGGYDPRNSGPFRPEKEAKSGGFHLFGGGDKEPKYSQPKFSEPKFKEPKMSSKSFGGGHSGGGGHSSKHHG